MTEIEIYLDMDGVCVDFMAAAIQANGFDPDTTLARWLDEHPGELFPEPLLGKSAMEFFTHEHLHTEQFWRELTPYPWFDRLMEELNRLGHVVFLTAPTNAPGCVAGKHHWLKARFGETFADFIFTRHKDRLAHPNACLVDDMSHNIDPFNRRNGHGVLFPQTWNNFARQDGSHLDDPVTHVVESIERRFAS